MSIIDLVQSAFGGGALGAAAAALGRWQQGKQEVEKLKLVHAHEQAMAKLELQQAKAMADIEFVKGSSNIQVASYDHDANIAGIGFVGAVRALVRPLLTMFLVGSTALLGLQLASVAAIPQDTAISLLQQIVGGLVSCTSMALAWWFGVRRIK